MDSQLMLQKPFPLSGSKLLFAFIALLFTGCWSINPDYENQLLIDNTTLDTLYFQSTKLYIDDFPFDDLTLLPGTNRIGEHESKLSMEMIEKNWKFRGDTVEIIRKGYKTIKWAAPLREMPDSVHHFFNKNSWEIKMGGHKSKYEIATFTITENDFVKE